MTGLFAPPPALPAHLEQFRFWIWLQLVALRLHVRALRGPGVRFRCGVDVRGDVYLDYICEELPAPDANPFAFAPSVAYRAALGGDDIPIAPFPHPLRRQGCAATSTGSRPCLRRGHGRVMLPPPDT